MIKKIEELKICMSGISMSMMYRHLCEDIMCVINCEFAKANA